MPSLWGCIRGVSGVYQFRWIHYNIWLKVIWINNNTILSKTLFSEITINRYPHTSCVDRLSTKVVCTICFGTISNTLTTFFCIVILCTLSRTAIFIDCGSAYVCFSIGSEVLYCKVLCYKDETTQWDRNCPIYSTSSNTKQTYCSWHA